MSIGPSSFTTCCQSNLAFLSTSTIASRVRGFDSVSASFCVTSGLREQSHVGPELWRLRDEAGVSLHRMRIRVGG